MINIIIVSIVVLNIVSILSVFNMLKGLETRFKIAIILIIVNFILANIICSIGQANLLQEMANNIKPLILFSIFPINMIVIASPIAIQINKFKSSYIEKDKFIKNIIICLVIDIIIIILECNYVRNIGLEILKMAPKN